MAPKAGTDTSADPATASYMRDIGRVSLLTHREEQNCGILIERLKYYEDLYRKARFPKTPYVSIGILRRLERQKHLISVLALIADLPADPALSQIRSQPAFRELVDLKLKDSTIKKIRQLTRPGSTLRSQSELARRTTLISKDTMSLTDTIIHAAHDSTVNCLQDVIADSDTMQHLRDQRPALDQDFDDFTEQAKRAQDKLTEANMRLVVSIATDFTNNNIPLLDLAQEGSIGLIDASQRYNHRLGFKFSTYATHWIRHRITKALAKQGRAIRIPENKHKLAREIYFARNDLAQELGRDATDAETSSRMNITLDTLQHIDQIDQNPDSLDELMFEDESTTRAERVASRLPGPEERAINNMLRPDLETALSILNPTEKMVISMRYGLDDDVNCTASEIAKAIRADREDVRDIERSAIHKIQSNAKVMSILSDYR